MAYSGYRLSKIQVYPFLPPAAGGLRGCEETMMYLIQVHTAISSLELKVKIGKAVTAIATKVELAKASKNFPCPYPPVIG